MQSHVSVLFAILVLLAASFVAGDNTDTGKAFLGRAWQLDANATYLTADVINTFLREFGPVVSSFPGFEEYVGSIVDNSDNFFFNVFDTAAEASTAQTAAKNFYTSSVLSSQISPVQFFSGTFGFHYKAQPAVTVAGRYLSVRYWQLQQGATYGPQDVLNAFQSGFAPVVQTFAGFQQYAGILLTGDATHVLFFNVFDSREQAAAANAAAKSFVTDGVLSSQISIVFAVTAAAMYDLQPAEESSSSHENRPHNELNFIFSGMLPSN